MYFCDPQAQGWEVGAGSLPAKGWGAVKRAGRFVSRRVFRRPSAAERDTLILDVSAMIRMGRLGDADRKLNAFTNGLASDAGYMNLCGAVCERRGERGLAARFYHLATTVDGEFVPARQNLARLREQGRVAKSVREIELGDGEVRRRRRLGEPDDEMVRDGARSAARQITKLE